MVYNSTYIKNKNKNKNRKKKQKKTQHNNYNNNNNNNKRAHVHYKSLNPQNDQDILRCKYNWWFLTDKKYDRFKSVYRNHILP